MHKVITGQILLVICCIFYVIWWSLCYKPDVIVNRTGGINGILLLITAGCGLAGTALTLYGLNAMPLKQTPKLNGSIIILDGIIVYFALMAITRGLLKRPVTTELVLITAWAMLEVSVINTLTAGQVYTDKQNTIAMILIAIAFVISMILYVLYYKMEPMKAYDAAMVPLITEAISMAIVTVMAFV